MLGAAGCKWTTENALCGFCSRDTAGNFYCSKYHVTLEKHHTLDEPWRSKKCSNEAFLNSNK